MNWCMEELFSTPMQMSVSTEEDDEALKWAALEKLPTYNRLRKTVLKTYMENENNEGNYNKVIHREVDVRNLDMHDRQEFIDKHFKVAKEDNGKFLRKFRNRIGRLGMDKQGLPIGKQLIGHPWCEASIFLLAASIEVVMLPNEIIEQSNPCSWSG